MRTLIRYFWNQSLSSLKQREYCTSTIYHNISWASRQCTRYAMSYIKKEYRIIGETSLNKSEESIRSKI